MLARVELRSALADNNVPRNNILVCDVSFSKPRPLHERGGRTGELFNSQPFSRRPSVVSDRAAGAFRGGPDRSQACGPGREPWQRETDQ